MKQLRIGRNPDNDIVLDDNSVSRYHATLVILDDSYIFSDNNSSNGSFINGKKIIGEVEVKENDIIKLGNVLLPWMKYVGLKKDSKDKTEISIESEVQIPEPYINKSSTTDNSTKSKKTSNSKKWIVRLVVFLSIIVVCFFVFVILMNTNNSEYYSSDPMPEIVSERTKVENRGVFDKTLIGYVEVLNPSNFEENVEVIAKCTQENETWTETKTVFLNPGETKIIQFEFRQIKRLKFEPKFSSRINLVE